MGKEGQPEHAKSSPSAEGPLERWLAGEPIQPTRVSETQQLMRWCHKRPWLTASLAGTAALLFLAAILGTAGYWHTAARLSQTEQIRLKNERLRLEAETRADEEARLAQQRQRKAREALLAQQEAERRRLEAEKHLHEAQRQRRIAEQQRIRAEREARIALACQLADQSRKTLETHPHQSLFLAGESLRALMQEGRRPDRDTEQILRDALARIGGRSLSGHRGGIQTLAISPDDRWLVTGSDDNTACLWDLTAYDPAEAATLLEGHEDRVGVVAISPDSHWLVTAGDDGTAMLWNLTAEDPSTEPLALRSHRGPINAVTFSADSRWLVTAGGKTGLDDNDARLWDLAADDLARRRPLLLRGHQKPILATVISPDDRWIATAGKDKNVRMYRLTASCPAAEQVVLRGHDGWIGTMAASPDGHWLATGSYDGTIRLWDLGADDPAGSAVVLRGHQGWITSIAISRDGRWLASGSFDKTARLWELASDDPAAVSLELAGHEGRIRTIAFSPNGRWLVTGSFDKTTRLWDLEADDPAAEPIILRGHDGPVSVLAVSRDSRWLATGSGEAYDRVDGTVRLWDLDLEGLLTTARLQAARHLTSDQQKHLLLKAARQAETTR